MFQRSFPSVSPPSQTPLITLNLHYRAVQLTSAALCRRQMLLVVLSSMRKFLFFFFFSKLQVPSYRRANALVLPCAKDGRNPGCPRAGECVGAAHLPPPLHFSVMLFKPILHLWRWGLFCCFGPEEKQTFAAFLGSVSSHRRG